MSLLSGAGTTLPNTVQFYDFQSAAFTLPAMSAGGGPYPVTGSTRQIRLSSAKNVTKANSTDDVVLTCFWWHVSALITSSTTDSCALSMQYSTDGGSSWTTTAATAALTATSQNKSVTQCKSGANGVLFDIQGNALTNPLLFRLAVEDSTDPTTDALTITNIRVTLAMLVMS